MIGTALVATATVTLSLSLPLIPTATAHAPSRIETPVMVAIEHVQRHHRQLGLRAADVAHLRITDAYRSTHTGVTHVYLRQTIHDLDVERGNVTVNVMPDRSILSIGSRLEEDITSRVSRTAELNAVAAARRAAEHLHLTSTTDPVVLSEASVGDRRTTLLWSAISVSPIPLRLVYHPAGDGRLRLAWQLEIEEVSHQHWWQIAVDAETGNILAKTDYVNQHTDPHREEQRALGTSKRELATDGSSYRVYALPLESPNDGDRRLVKSPADKKASPFGWHDTDGRKGHEYTTTRGNNVHAYADYSPGFNSALPTMDADGGTELAFDFDLDFTLPPQLWKDAAVTNLFYWNNITHDIAYRYGFNEAAGNFQVKNYSNKGSGGDPVQAEAQDGQGVNNANFATPPEGQSPRMQMFLWPSTPHRQLIDGDLDGGVIIHEYGHGISNRLTGGPSNATCLFNQEQGGEGWSDWLAVAFTTRNRAEIHKPRGIGTYVLGQEDRHQKGIRPTPYSIDKAVNPTTYDSIKSSAVPHGVGYVWASMLWDLYANLVKKHGFNQNVYAGWQTGGNNLAIQLVMDGMKMQACEPGFVDSRDAILDADKALTGGRNWCIIWHSFASRGLGVKANQGASTSVADGQEDFSTPPACEKKNGKEKKGK